MSQDSRDTTPKILIAAFDGLQPSQVTPDRMPVVSALADNGVRFLHNHAVFPTVTRANSASLVTGVRPGTHGLTANKSVFPEFSRTEVVDALVPQLPEISSLTNGGLLFVPTLGEILGDRDLKWVSVVGGTSGNAYVQCPNAEECGAVIIHPEFTNPARHNTAIIEKFGEWPAKEAPAADLVVRTADVAIDYALTELDPDVLLVWFPEPDTSQHAFGVDSPEAQAMYSLADSQLGRVLDELRGKGGTPDVFVVSDHGYSTIDTVIDVRAELTNAGFSAEAGTRSRVVIAENGGSVLFYVPGGDNDTIQRLLEWLPAQDWVGAVAVGDEMTGSAGLAQMDEIGLSGRRSPDIAITMRANLCGKSAPLAVLGAAAGGVVGVGSHGGGSAAELHNTLIASGPSFKAGVKLASPSGNIDVAPTVLQLLGVPVPDHMEGRVLSEVLDAQMSDPQLPETDGTSNAESARISSSITSAETNGVRYLCEFGAPTS